MQTRGGWLTLYEEFWYMAALNLTWSFGLEEARISVISRDADGHKIRAKQVKER